MSENKLDSDHMPDTEPTEVELNRCLALANDLVRAKQLKARGGPTLQLAVTDRDFDFIVCGLRLFAAAWLGTKKDTAKEKKDGA